MEILRSRTELRSLDHALFVDVPLDGLKQRDEFYICNELIQLMENVYADLDLEKYYAHPHVQGWMSVFQKWAQHGAFQNTWKISRTTYAKRFQRFFEDRLCKAPNSDGRVTAEKSEPPRL
jgi:hypothetical protein